LSGLYMIRNAFVNQPFDETRQSLPTAKRYIKAAAENIVISAAVYAALYCAYAKPLAEMLIAPATSLLLTAGGVVLGYWRGFRRMKWPYIVGAVILFAAAFVFIV
ncbi:MAG TPA: hypothetical protein PKV44_04935, partial [Bacillota bacterium]|nr:hypothetical protein [Bacillota bacterium]